MKTIYVGCYASDDYYVEEYEPSDIVTWYQREVPEYEFAILNEKLETFKAREYPECYYEYIQISEQLLNILLCGIEHIKIEPIDFSEKTFSRISSLYFAAEDKTIELIVDECNGYYFINEIHKDGFGQIPMRIYKYMLKGLNKVGFRKINKIEVE